MTEPVRPLEALIAEWRESAQWESESNMQYAQALDQCADELEAALLHAAAPPERVSEGKALPSPMHSFDARVWAQSFVAHVKQHPNIPSDTETMTTWFASALMRGVDEAHRAARPAVEPREEPTAECGAMAPDGSGRKCCKKYGHFDEHAAVNKHGSIMWDPNKEPL